MRALTPCIRVIRARRQRRIPRALRNPQTFQTWQDPELNRAAGPLGRMTIHQRAFGTKRTTSTDLLSKTIPTSTL